MALVSYDNVKETSTTTGTGAFTLSGAVTGFRSFSSKCSTGDLLMYGIKGVDSNGNATGEWEIGYGSYSGTNTLTRTTVLASSNSGSLVSFSSGTKHCYITQPAASVSAIAVTPMMFGAKGDGTTDDTAAIQAAMNSGAKSIYLPAGTYKLTSTLTLPAGVSLIGDGSDKSILDGSAATFASLTNGYHLTNSKGTFTSLPSLSGNVSRGGRTLTFSSAPSVAADDILYIHNPTSGSWLSDRTYYLQGEYVRVSTVSGSTVTIQGTLADSYTAASVTVYKLTGTTTATFRGFKLIGRADTSNQVYGLMLFNLRDATIADVAVVNCSYMNLTVWDSVNVLIQNCYVREDGASSFGGDYGLTIMSCHHLTVDGGEFNAARHGIALSGGGTSGGGPGDGPCRYVNIVNTRVSTNAAGSVNALDLHGACEYITIEGNVVDGGIITAGDFTRILNNTIICAGFPGIYATEFKGWSHEIRGNLIISDGTSDALRGQFIEFGGNGGGLTTTATRGGTTIVEGNRMQMRISAINDSLYPMMFANWGYNGNDALHISIVGNTIDVIDPRYRVSFSQVINGGAYRPFDSVTMIGNHFHGASGLYTSTSGTVSAKKVIISGNTFINGGGSYTNKVFNVSELISVKNNTFAQCKGNGGWFMGASGANCKFVTVTDNTLQDMNCVPQVDSTTDADFMIYYATYATVHGNSSDSRSEYLTVSSNTSFTQDETITGGTSGATAKVRGKVGTTIIAIEKTRSGTFSAETITGGTSGATTSVSATNLCQVSNMVYNTITQLWTGRNVATRSLSDSSTSVSTTTAI